MALVLFSCRATGPFIMFEETAKQIFKISGIEWKEQGAIPAEDIPETLRILEEAGKANKARLAEIEAEKRRLLREASYDEEFRLREKWESESEVVNLYQRSEPLLNMMRRAIRHNESVMWGRP